MTYKQIEASREARLWISQVIVPVIGVAGAVVMSIPEARQAVVSKARSIKQTITNKFIKD
jgi:hypothetical protein